MPKGYKHAKRVVIVPTYLELQLGTAQRQRDIHVGGVYELSPACDLWMRGAKTARVKVIYEDSTGRVDILSVAPIVNGTEIRGTHRIAVSHIA